LEYISTVKGEGGGLSDTMTADFRMNPNFRLRPTGFNNAEGLSRLTWSNIARCYGSSDQFNCSTRRNGVAYVSPDLKGVLEGWNVSWGWFEDDDWGAAVRYKNTWNDTWLFAAGVGYENIRDERLQAGGGGEATGNVPIPQQFPPPATRNKQTFFQREFNEWAGSVGLRHKPSGLFGVGIFSTSETDDTNAIGFYTGRRAPDMTAWDVQLGIDRKFFDPGPTSFWGGFGQVNDGFGMGSNGNGGNLGGVPANGVLSPGTFVNINTPVELTGTEVNRWFLALDQDFAAAAMHLYAVYQHFDADLNLVTRDGVSCAPNNNLNCASFGKLRAVPEKIDDFDLFYTGGRIYF
jgi:hypothetical protein